MILSVQFNDLVLPDTPDIALVAHGDIAVVAPQHHLGALGDDVALFKKHVAPHVKIKAAGGISSLEDAEKFIELGADRLGTSRIVKIAKGLENDNAY